MIIIHLRSIQFSVIGTVVGCHEVDEFDMSSIVPSEFKSDLSKYTITSLAPALSDSSIFDADFGQLFQEQYLSLTHTKYFSTRGARMENLNAHPVQNTIFKSIEDEGNFSCRRYIRKRSVFSFTIVHGWNQNFRTIQSRDSLPALAIGLVRLCTVLFSVPFPEFLNNKISENCAEDYIKKTSSFK
ncbi:hypothetical protein INT48_004034, partial [Thamnidium elegans]